jgi:hypothetical protein
VAVGLSVRPSLDTRLRLGKLNLGWLQIELCIGVSYDPLLTPRRPRLAGAHPSQTAARCVRQIRPTGRTRVESLPPRDLFNGWALALLESAATTGPSLRRNLGTTGGVGQIARSHPAPALPKRMFPRPPTTLQCRAAVSWLFGRARTPVVVQERLLAVLANLARHCIPGLGTYSLAHSQCGMQAHRNAP